MTKSLISLNQENYYSKKASWNYFSKSLYFEFEKCEAETLARLKDEYEPDTDIEALLVGNYVHSYFEGTEAHEKFISEHKDQLLSTRGKTKGKLKAGYKLADKMIESLDSEQLFTDVYKPGKKEVIVTGEINGIHWKGKIDSLNLDEEYFCDLKTTADINKKIWNPDQRQKQNFIEAYGYYTQIALYKELIKQTFGVECVPFIFAVSKQDPPDKAAIKFSSDDDQMLLNYYFDQLVENQQHMFDVLNGIEKPNFCGKCEYCRSVKKLAGFTDASKVGAD